MQRRGATVGHGPVAHGGALPTKVQLGGAVVVRVRGARQHGVTRLALNIYLSVPLYLTLTLSSHCTLGVDCAGGDASNMDPVDSEATAPTRGPTVARAVWICERQI